MIVRKIPEYEGRYLISDSGDVYSIRRQGSDGGMIRQHENSNGYACVDLWTGHKKKKELVHRLVAKTYLEKKEGKEFVNHKDGNKKNNHVSNLEWCNRSENMKHAVLHGLNKIPMLSNEKHPNHKLTDIQVDEIRTLFSKGMNGAELGRKYGVSKNQIYNIVHGKQRKRSINEKEGKT